MPTELVDSGWFDLLDSSFRSTSGPVRIVSPFIKRRTVERLLGHFSGANVQVITRLKTADFAAGASDVNALELLLKNGASVRTVFGLHTKLFIFGFSKVLITSANLTESGLFVNKEVGVFSDDPILIASSHRYFGELWSQAGPDVDFAKLETIRLLISRYALDPRNSLGHLYDHDLDDFGTRVEASTEVDGDSVPERAFVKFIGEAHLREVRSFSVLHELQSAGCHRVCGYPKGKRPRRVGDGDTMFMGRLVVDPKDILIFGRALATRHVEDRDDASDADIERRPWKRNWPHYVRVHHPRFVAGSLGNGVSLNELIDDLGPNAFRSTQENLRSGVGNTNPRWSIRQQPAVELSHDGTAWLLQRLEEAFRAHGTLSHQELATLDWPELPWGP